MHHEILIKLSSIIEERLGYYYPENRLNELRERLSSFIKEQNIKDFLTLSLMLSGDSVSSDLLMALTRHLTVGETFFMRDIKAFEVLQDQIIPSLIKDKGDSFNRQINILSAGCATGEEPYSIAIIIDRLSHLLKDYDVKIKAFDVNDLFIQRAIKGIYKEWSFRGTPEWLKKDYFLEKKNGLYEIIPKIKKMVDFYHFNLHSVKEASNHILPQYDVIFCRNTIMYFEEQLRLKVLSYLTKLLFKGGWLITSPIEIQSFVNPELILVNFDGFTVFQRQRGYLKKDVDETIKTAPTLLMTYNKTKDLIELHREATSKDVPINQKSHEVTIEDNGNTLTEILNDAQQKANMGLLDDALKILDKAVKLNSLDRRIYYLKATVLEEIGDLQNAEETWKKLLYIDSNSVLARFRLGSILLKLNRTEDALREFDNVIRALDSVDKEFIVEELGMNAGRIMDISKTIIQEISIK